MMQDFFSRLTGAAPHWVDVVIYAAIALVSLTGVLKCLLPLWGTTHALRRAVRRLQEHSGDRTERPVWQESRFMGKRLRGSWQRFLQNAQQLDARRLPCNVEDYINDDTVTHGPGNATLAELIPGLLTSLGILGTFIGLMRGLTGLDMTDADTLMDGIPVLLDGMRFAFGTSVAGISCSLIFNMINRIAQGTSYRAIDDFVASFQALAMERPLDNDVQMICQNEDRNTLIRNSMDQLSGSIEDSVAHVMRPVADSMDRFLAGATRAQVDGVGRIVNTFIARMNEELNGQFFALGQTLTDINRHQQLTMDRVDASVEAGAAIRGEAEKLHGISGDIIARFESYVAAVDATDRRDARFQQASSDLLASMHDASAAQKAMLDGLEKGQKELQASIEAYRKSAESAGGAESAAQDLEKASIRLSESCADFAAKASDALQKQLDTFDRQMTELNAVLKEEIDALDRMQQSSVPQLNEMQRLLGSVEQQLTVLNAREARHGEAADS